MGAAANPIRLSASTAASEGSRHGGLDDYDNHESDHDDDVDDMDDNADDSGNNNDNDMNHPSGDLRSRPTRVQTDAIPYSRAEEKKILTTHIPSLTSSIVRTTASAVPPFAFAGLPLSSAARPPSSAARPRSSAVPLVGMPSPHRRVRQLSESTVDALNGVRSSYRSKQ